MRIRFLQTAAIGILLAATAGRLSADPILQFTVSDLTGPAGSTVGWGGSINNTTSNWIEITSSQFCVPAPVSLTPAFTCSSPTTGTYNDIIAGIDPIIAPGDTYNAPFDSVGFTNGIGFFAIDPSQVNGNSDVGSIVLTYDAYNGDPNSGGTQIFDPLPSPFEAEASVTVDSSPEPSTGVFAAPILLLLIAGFRRFRPAPAAALAKFPSR